MVDVSNREHVVFCVRWLDEDLLSYEDFIGLYEMEKTDATTMDVSILRLGLDKAKFAWQMLWWLQHNDGEEEGSSDP